MTVSSYHLRLEIKSENFDLSLDNMSGFQN